MSAIRWCLSLWCILVFANEEAMDAQRAANLKKHRTPHFTIITTGELLPYAASLGSELERFIAELERRWSVILPREPIDISMSSVFKTQPIPAHVEAPGWLVCGYDEAYQRIEVRLRTGLLYQKEPVVRALRHEIIHTLLRRAEVKRLPYFLEEGLAQYYGNRNLDSARYLAIWAFARNPDMAAFLEDEATFEAGDRFLYGAAVSGRLMTWLWEDQLPGGGTLFMQQLLQGHAWETALRQAGWRDVYNLARIFDQTTRPEYGLHTLAFTRDFWLMVFGALTLLWMMARVVKAFRIARLPITEPEMETLPVDEPDAELFTGPAFGFDRERVPEPIEPDPRPEPTPEHSETLDRDLDSVFARLSPQAADPDTEANVRIENDLDDAFENLQVLSGKGEQKKQKTDPFEDMDGDLDQLFEDWDTKRN